MSEVCFKIGKACENPLYLNWKNTLGGWDKWLFDCKQTYSINTSTLGDFSPYFENITTQQYTRELLKRDAFETAVLGADHLTLNEVKGIEDMFYSPRVYVLVEWNPPTAPVWRQVIVNEGSTQLYISSNTLHTLEFEIEFPQLYTLQN